jgi:hypothetical protein
MVLIYGEARGHSKLARQIYGERFPQRILPNARTFVNVVQHLRDFRRFEMNKRDLGRQREDRILVAEGEILHEIDSILLLLLLLVLLLVLPCAIFIKRKATELTKGTTLFILSVYNHSINTRSDYHTCVIIFPLLLFCH